MVHVLLIILKVLGITLLILLGVALLLLLLLLLAPFRYTVEAEYYGDIRAVGRIRWLCFVLDLKGIYGNSKFLYYLKSFGFTISTNDETDKHYRKGVPEEKDAEESLVPVTLVEDDFDSYVKEREHSEPKAEANPSAASESGNRKQSGRRKPPGTKEDMENAAVHQLPKKRQGFFARIDSRLRQAMQWLTTIPERIHNKISEILSRILDFFANIKENVSRLIKKKDTVIQKAKDVGAALRKDSTKRAFRDLKRQAGKLLKHIRPKRFHGLVHFGMEDPSVTGQVLGALGVLMPLYRNSVVIAPDFEQKIFEGEFYARGSIRLGVPLTLLLQMLWNRNFMQTVQEIRKILGGTK